MSKIMEGKPIGDIPAFLWTGFEQKLNDKFLNKHKMEIIKVKICEGCKRQFEIQLDSNIPKEYCCKKCWLEASKNNEY